MDRMPKAPASPVLVSAPVDGLGVPLNLEARAARLLDEGQAVVLLTVVEREGSAPRAAGTRALLTAAGLEGTVGGGLLEARAVEAANVCLKEGRSARVRCDLTGLGPDSDMICGGSMDLLCEYLTPAQAPLFRAAGAALKAGLTGIWLLDVSRADAPVRDLYLDALPEGQPLVAGLHEGAEAVRPLLAGRKGRPGLVREGLVERYVEALDAPPVLLLCGGGHVSLETARLAHAAGFVVDVVDDRAEFADPRRFPMARRCLTLPAFEGLAARCGIGRHHYVAIMTRGHSFDREVLAQALKTDAFYIGMIDSSSKKASVYKALRAQGVSDAALDKVCCPIGLGIGADTPQQIAVSVVAELMAARAGTLGALRAAR